MLIQVKVPADRLIRHPFTKQKLPQVGGDEDPFEIEDTDLHWARLLGDGDLIVCKPQPAKPAKAASKDDPA